MALSALAAQTQLGKYGPSCVLTNLGGNVLCSGEWVHALSKSLFSALLSASLSSFVNPPTHVCVVGDFLSLYDALASPCGLHVT